MALRRRSALLPILTVLGLSSAFLSTGLQGQESLLARPAKKSSATAELVPPKRPPSSYMSWLNDNRDSLVKKLGTNAVAEVAKAAGVAWKKLSAAKKKPYEKAATAAREEWKEKMEAFKSAGGVVPKRAAPGTRVAKKAPRDPNKPKRPLSSYMLWLNENRPSIVKKLPAGHKATEVMKEAGKQWGKLTAAKKKKYEKAAADLKAKYLEDMEKYKETV
eukprot:symbB.v1.2.018657.t1/scaffold1498.1/size115254/3